MKLVYIAGPYRHVEGGKSVEQNILAARRVGLQVVQQYNGLFPVVPHMNTANMELDAPEVGDLYWLRGTMAMMLRCDAVLLIAEDSPSASVGTRREVEEAKLFGIPVFSDISDLVNWYYMQEETDDGGFDPPETQTV